MCDIIQSDEIPLENQKKFQNLLQKKKAINPRLQIETFQYINSKEFHVVQDGYLIAGSKSRVAIPLIQQAVKKNPNIRILTYCGTFNGYGACATAFAAYKLGLQSEVFLSKVPTNSHPREWSKKDILQSRQLATLLGLHAKVHLCPDFKTARALQYSITTREIPGKKNEWSMVDGYYNVDMGLLDKNGIMVKILSSQIKKASKNTLLTEKSTPHFWLVAGTSGIARSIKAAFPDCTIHLLFVGGGRYLKEALLWAKKTSGVHILQGESNLNQPEQRKNRPKYYQSTAGYDDRIWPYVKKYGKSGDFIWNVASDVFL